MAPTLICVAVTPVEVLPVIGDSGVLGGMVAPDVAAVVDDPPGAAVVAEPAAVVAAPPPTVVGVVVLFLLLLQAARSARPAAATASPLFIEAIDAPLSRIAGRPAS